jgi:hypothetical protein
MKAIPSSSQKRTCICRNMSIDFSFSYYHLTKEEEEEEEEKVKTTIRLYHMQVIKNQFFFTRQQMCTTHVCVKQSRQN